MQRRRAPITAAKAFIVGAAARGLAVSALMVALAGAAWAQAVSPTGQIPPGQTRPLPEAAPPSFDFRIEQPRPSPVPRAVEELSFTISDIQVTGVTVYPAGTFAPLIKPLVGKSVHLSDIVKVADAIEAQYRGDGFILTRAYVPAQSVGNGVFRIAVVEGYVAGISVTGGTDDARARVEQILMPITASRPLKLDVIEGALLVANNLPGVNVAGVLRPSPSQPGASDLVATLTADRATMLLSVDNRGAPLTEVWTGAANIAVRSPFDEGGVILMSVSAAIPDPQIRYSASGKYIYPLGNDGILLSVSALDAHGQPAGGVAGGISQDFISENQTFGARVTVPVVTTRETRLSLDAGFTWQKANVTGLALGAIQHDEWRDFDLALIYQQNGFLQGVTSATVDVTQGVDILGASPRGDIGTSRGLTPPDPSFTKLSAILRRTQEIYGPLSLSVVGTGQYAFETVFLGEEISFGGAEVGRGYDPAALTGDIGVGADTELRYDLVDNFQIESPAIKLSHAEAYGFYDVAEVWNHVGPYPNNFLESTGVGVRGNFENKLQLGLEVAVPLITLPTSDFGKRAVRILFNGSTQF
jgi:hemolysin activation/secretion protein